MPEHVSFLGLPNWNDLSPKAEPLLKTGTWAGTLSALGLQLMIEAKTAMTPEDSEWLRRQAEKGWTYETWLKSVELLVESGFPRARMMRHVKLKGRRFAEKHIATAMSVIFYAAQRVRKIRRWLRLVRAIAWAARITRAALAVSWIALAVWLPLRWWLAVPLLWLASMILRVGELFEKVYRRENRRMIILAPPLEPGRFGIYLRSFRGDEHLAAADQLPLALRLSFARPVWPGTSLIERVGRTLKPIGPLVAFGWPEDLADDVIPLPVLAVPDRNWQEWILAAAHDAAVIIVDVNARSEGFAWELEQIIGSDLLQKTVFLLPYDPLPSLTETFEDFCRTHGLIPAAVTPHRNVHEAVSGVYPWLLSPLLPTATDRYEHFRRTCAKAGLQVPDHDPRARFLYFDGERRAHVLPESPTNAVRPRAVALLDEAFASSDVPQTYGALVAFHLTRKSLFAACHIVTIAVALWLG